MIFLFGNEDVRDSSNAMDATHLIEDMITLSMHAKIMDKIVRCMVSTFRHELIHEA